MRPVMRGLSLGWTLVLLLTACVGGTQEDSTTRPGHGVVAVEVSNLVGSSGSHLGGVLMRGQDGEGWDGVAGFAVIPDSYPYSGLHVLGEVNDEWGDLETGLWPWAFGTADIPPGDYTLTLWIGKDFCCYSRWMPASSPGLRFCEMEVTMTGEGQIIRVGDIPYHPPLSDESFYPCG